MNDNDKLYSDEGLDEGGSFTDTENEAPDSFVTDDAGMHSPDAYNNDSTADMNPPEGLANEETMGEKAEDAWDKTKNAARDAWDNTKDSAKDTMDDIRR
jgi:hypothetical protein